MHYIIIGSRCLLGLIFAVAAVSKLRSRAAFSAFAETVSGLRVFDDRWVRPVAAAVALGEAFTAALMVAPRPLAATGFALAAVMLTAFAVIIVSGRQRGIRTRCRCFGAATATLGSAHVARNAALAVAASISAFGLVAAPQGSVHPGGFAIAAVAGVALALLTLRLDDLIKLFESEPYATNLNPRSTQQ